MISMDYDPRPSPYDNLPLWHLIMAEDARTVKDEVAATPSPRTRPCTDCGKPLAVISGSKRCRDCWRLGQFLAAARRNARRREAREREKVAAGLEPKQPSKRKFTNPMRWTGTDR